MTGNSLKKLFEKPPEKFRSIPFWAWNDELDSNEMTEQINSMKAHGMGGFFMHSREGLETEYMGPKWMECIRASVDAARKNGLYAWLYDEDRWPSGTAGGKVPSESDDFRAKGLTSEISGEAYNRDSTVQALFKARIDDMDIIECIPLDIDMDFPAPEEGVYLIYRMELSEPSEWFNNQSPPDNLNPSTVRCFIEKTHEEYKEYVGDEFGKTIPGIFTDEPGIHDRHCHFKGYKGWLPWTEGLPGFFYNKHGYDVKDIIPYIFFNGELSSKARHDYWRTITEMFSEAYSRQLYSWCEENRLAFTGHFLWENNMGVATRVCGAVMPNYRYQHVPGIDMLNMQTDEYITVKQCTSVANQYGRKQVITETYGCTGWDFDFEGQKWIGDFQFVMGVNIRCQHLALYSLRGCRKRDYPPVFNYNTSWWKYNYVIEDYFARLSAVLSEGEPVRDILVIHPASTGWSMMGSNPYGLPKRGNDRDIPAVKKIGDEFNLFLKYLMGCHDDFDLGDEIIMEESGYVRDGHLFINKKGYGIVIVPPVKTLFKSTICLLGSFMDAGGFVIAVEPVPTMISGVLSQEIGWIFSHKRAIRIPGWKEAGKVLQKTHTKMVSIQNKYNEEIPTILYMLRETDHEWILFVVNNDRSFGYDTTIEINAIGRLEEWIPLTGGINTPVYSIIGQGMLVKAYFKPVESRLYVIRKGEVSAAEKAEKPAKLKSKIILDNILSFTRTMPNALVLDKCSCSTGGEWSEIMDVWQAQRQIRTALKMNPVYYNDELPQRYTWIHKPHPNDGKPVSFRFTFYIKQMPESEMEFVLERPEWFQIELNGIKQGNEPKGYFLDKALSRIPLKGLKKGINVLSLSCEYKNSMEVEDCYIIGDFALDENSYIIKERDKLCIGDWNTQGYKHYAGSMVYHMEYRQDYEISEKERIYIKLGSYSAITIEIKINGREAGHIPWRAASFFEITPYIKQGCNEIDIEVMGSPRNLFGPFHQAAKSNTVNWLSFRTEGEDYTPDYNVKPYGLFEPAEIIIYD